MRLIKAGEFYFNIDALLYIHTRRPDDQPLYGYLEGVVAGLVLSNNGSETRVGLFPTAWDELRPQLEEFNGT